MKLIFVKASFIIVVAGLLLSGCKNTDKPDLDTNTTLDNANSQSVFDDALKVSEDVLHQNSKAKLATGTYGIACAMVTYVAISSTHYVYTLDFDAISNCTNYDGKLRKGKLIVDIQGSTLHFDSLNTVTTIKSVGYSVNGVLVNGMKTVTCVAVTPNIQHNIVVSDTTTGTDYATITYTDGSTAKWKSKRTRALIAGSSTPEITDNVYDISATSGIGNPAASGINREGRSYNVNISSPVRIDFNCFTNNTARYPTQGILELQPDGKTSRSIDYGDGTCDNKAKVTINGKSYDIVLAY